MEREVIAGTVAEGAVFTGVDWGSVIDGEYLRCTFVGSRLSEGTAAESRFVECRFEKCDLNLWRPINSVIGGCLFIDCRMLGIDWTQAVWPRVPLHEANVFTRCDLSLGAFADLDLGPVLFEECRLREVSFRHARMAGADLSGSDCLGADFYAADLSGARLVGVKDLSVDPRTAKLEGSTVNAVTGMAILESLGITLEASELDPH